MNAFESFLDSLKRGSARPFRRLIAYYVVLAAALSTLAVLSPVANGAMVDSGIGAPCRTD
jgi:hypothetical protein